MRVAEIKYSAISSVGSIPTPGIIPSLRAKGSRGIQSIGTKETVGNNKPLSGGTQFESCDKLRCEKPKRNVRAPPHPGVVKLGQGSIRCKVMPACGTLKVGVLPSLRCWLGI